MIKKDYHVHLHGCLTPEDLWEIGKDQYQSRTNLLDWYAAEYQSAWGYKPQYLNYWQKENGYDLLKKDYLFLEQNNFERFQANFNLIIAVCPIVPDDFSIQNRIIDNVAKKGLQYFEARTLIPFRLEKKEAFDYLKGLCQTVQKSNIDSNLNTKLVFSLFRQDDLAKKHYSWLRAFMKQEKELAQEIEGLDFAFNEKGFPPKDKEEFIKQFYCDNQKFQKLSLLYHVGESFEDKSIFSAMRWVYEACQLGVDRLGHGIALGVDPENYKGLSVYESATERLDTLLWLLDEEEKLKTCGYPVDKAKVCYELERIRTDHKPYLFVYNKENIDEARCLQKAVIKLIKEQRPDVIVEVCPTSNLRIGQVHHKKYHPLRAFHREGLSYAICTDDPGIFNTDWVKEEVIANEILNL